MLREEEEGEDQRLVEGEEEDHLQQERGRGQEDRVEAHHEVQSHREMEEQLEWVQRRGHRMLEELVWQEEKLQRKAE